MAGLFDDLITTHPLIDGIPPEVARALQMQDLQSLGLNLGTALLTQRGLGPALAQGMQNWQAGQGPMQDRILRGLLAANQLRQGARQHAAAQRLADTAPPPGVSPEQWRAYATLDPAAAIKLAIASRPTRPAAAVPGAVSRQRADGAPQPGSTTRPSADARTDMMSSSGTTVGTAHVAPAGKFAFNKQTGRVIEWNGAAWVDPATRQPIAVAPATPAMPAR